MNVGFIGLGLMGTPMARNILKKGFSLAVYNRTAGKTQELETLGASVCRSPAEVAQKSDVVISIVTGPEDVREIMLGESGVINGARKGLIAVDMSTIGPKAAVGIAQELGTAGIEFLDCPVTGSTYRAETGELTIFAGGKKEIFEKARPVLEVMGTDIHYMGPSGSGQAIKLVNNVLVASTLAALGEAVLLGDAEGLSRDKVAAALTNTPVMSPFMKLKIQNFVKGEYPVAFSIENMKKDLQLAAAEKKERYLRIFELVNELFQETINAGLSDEDVSAIMKVLEKRKK